MAELYRRENLKSNESVSVEVAVRKRERVRSEVEAVLGKGEMEKKRGVNGVFAVMPEGVRFEAQGGEEEIILLLRRHWFTNVRWVVIAGILAGLPVIFWVLPVWPGWAGINYRLVFSMLWYLLVGAYVVENALGWFFNVYIVTSERVVDIDFYSILHREVSDAELDKIQDVTVRTGGFGATMFNYADIYIQTAAERAVFEFLAVPSANKVAQIVRDLVEAEEEEANS